MSNQIKSGKGSAARKKGGFGRDISTPLGKLAAHVHLMLMDHGILRVPWTNLAQIAPGVWRSNQPSPARIARYKRMGIERIISLRGFGENSYTLLERAACEKHGIEFIVTAFHARRAPPRDKLLRVIELMETTPKPFLLHCKSGADRAGLASAIYLLQVEGRPLDEARKMLSLRFLHLRSTKTGILDEILDCYERDSAQTPMDFRTWAETTYDRDAVTASFARTRGKG